MKRIVVTLLKWSYPILFFFLFLMLIAFANSNFPSADDYTQAFVINKFGRLGVVKYWYMKWMGRYGLSLITSLTQPLSYHSLLLYKIYPVFVILSLLTSFYFFSRYFFKSLTNSSIIKIVTCFFILFYHLMPSVVEGIYWFPATGYLTGVALVLVFWIFIDKLHQRFKFQDYLIAAFVGIVCASHIEIFTIVVILITGLYLINYFILYKRVSIPITTMLVLLTFAGLASILAPGNFNRSNVGFIESNFNSQPQDLFYSIQLSLKYLGKDQLNQIILSPFILFIILSIVVNQRVKLFENLKIHPILLSVSIVLALISMHFIFYYGFGSDVSSPLRAQNSYLIFYIFSWIIILNHSLQWYNIKIPQPSISSIYVLHTVLIFSLIFVNGNITKSLKILRGRDHLAYKAEIESRFELIAKHQNDTLVVDSLKYFPRIIFFNDITADFSDPLHNQSYAKYWGLKAIRLKGEAPDYDDK